MFLTRPSLYVFPSALALLTASVTAQALPTKERTLFTWNGTVDREVLLFIRGRNVETRASGQDASYAPQLELRDELPRFAGDIDIHKVDGRGNIEVVQQPSARNDFTAIVRVSDPRAGADRYRVVVSWAPVVEVRDSRDRDRDGNRDGGRDNDWNRGRDGGPERGRDWWERIGRRDRDAGVLSWRGDVDDVAEIRVQGRHVEYRVRSGDPMRDVRFDVQGAGLPRRPVELEVDVVRGRGSVTVVQQPDARNGYTAVLRVVDRKSGYGDYDFDLRWH